MPEVEELAQQGSKRRQQDAFPPASQIPVGARHDLPDARLALIHSEARPKRGQEGVGDAQAPEVPRHTALQIKCALVS